MHDLHILPNTQFGNKEAENLECSKCGKKFPTPTLAAREPCVEDMPHWSNVK